MGIGRRKTRRDLPGCFRIGEFSMFRVAAMAACVLMAGPALASSKNESAALSRVDVQAQWAAELPQIISASDVAIYKRAFKLQAERNWAGADHELAKLKDRRLVGHVLADRYLRGAGWHAAYPELAGWLKEYADHPDASAVHQMALKRAPKKGAAPLRRPSFESLK